MTLPRIDCLDHFVLTVADAERTIAFYTRVLGMTHAPFDVPGESLPRHALSFGDSKINVHVAGREFEPKADRPVPGSADLCFLSATPLETWVAHLDGQGVPLLEGPVARTGAQGALLSIYLRDPDGNLIEVSNPV